MWAFYGDAGFVRAVGLYDESKGLAQHLLGRFSIAFKLRAASIPKVPDGFGFTFGFGSSKKLFCSRIGKENEPDSRSIIKQQSGEASVRQRGFGFRVAT